MEVNRRGPLYAAIPALPTGTMKNNGSSGNSMSPGFEPLDRSTK